MYASAKEFIDKLGGYRAVATRFGIGATTLHTHMTKGSLPSKWFTAFCTLSAEFKIAEPQKSLFSFEPLPKPKDEECERAA